MLINSERGIAHILLLVILLIGIGVGVYLVSQQQIFKPKASESSNTATKIKQLTSQINSKTENFGKPNFSLSNQESAQNDLVELAKERKLLLLEEIKSNPQTLIDNQISTETLEKLPEEARKYIEKDVQVDGELEILHMDSPTFKTATFDYTLKTSDEKITLFPTSQDNRLESNSIIKVNGLQIDSNIVVNTTDDNSVKVITASAPITTGGRGVIVILINLADLTHESNTLNDLRSELNSPETSFNNYYNESSYGKLNYIVRVADRIVPINSRISDGCQYQKWMNQTENEFFKMYGYSPAGTFNDVVYVTASTQVCPFGGIANVGGDWVVIPQYSSVKRIEYVMIHELGHNLGLFHSNSLLCKGNQGDYEDCEHVEYGDPLDPMGSSGELTQYDFYQKQRLNWTSPSDEQNITTNGVYNVYPMEENNNKIKALTMQAGSLPIYYLGFPYYQITYRRPIGFDKNLPNQYFEGAALYLKGSASYITYPGITYDRLSNLLPFVILQDNVPFYDPYNFLTITQLSHDSEKAVISIKMGSIKEKYGANLMAYLANNPPLNEKLGVIIKARSDISTELKAFGANVRSVIGDGKIITADSDLNHIGLIASSPNVISVDLANQNYLTGIRAPSRCEVEWSGILDRYPENIDFSPTIKVNGSSIGSEYVSVYLDDKKVDGGDILGDKKFQWKINSGTPGAHKLAFKVNDWVGYGITGQDSAKSEICTPTVIFNTVANQKRRPISTPVVKCDVAWDPIVGNYEPNTDFTISGKVTRSEVGKEYVSVYVDGQRVDGGDTSDDGFYWNINSGSTGDHSVQFKVNDWQGYGITGQDPKLSQFCEGELSFTTK